MLALADFGRDQRSGDSWKARRFVFYQVSNAPISRRPNFTKFASNTSIGVAMKTFGTEF